MGSNIQSLRLGARLREILSMNQLKQNQLILQQSGTKRGLKFKMGLHLKMGPY